MIARLNAGHRGQLAREMRAALPRECCGLIEGRHDESGFDIVALHPCRNVAREPDQFEIDPAEQFRLMRALRRTDRTIIGCYHSHPHGTHEPSQRDLASGSEDGFLWLIVAAGGSATTLGAYVYEGGLFAPVSLSAPE